MLYGWQWLIWYSSLSWGLKFEDSQSWTLVTLHSPCVQCLCTPVCEWECEWFLDVLWVTDVGGQALYQFKQFTSVTINYTTLLLCFCHIAIYCITLNFPSWGFKPSIHVFAWNNHVLFESKVNGPMSFSVIILLTAVRDKCLLKPHVGQQIKTTHSLRVKRQMER